MDLTFLSIILFSFLFTVGGLYLLIPVLIRNQFIDIPNIRSSHTKHTPRGGGLAIIFGILIGSFLAGINGYPIPDWSFFVAILVVFITSFIDDRKSLPVFTRLLLHSTAAGLVIYSTGGLKYIPLPYFDHILLGFWAIPVTYIWILAVLNIYNFLDGIDGFSSVQAIVAGLSIAFLDWGGIGMVLGILVCTTSFAFLLYNWHPAKVFMGDVGSITLGFMFASLPFYIKSIPSEKGVFIMAIFLWFFLSDGVFTIIRRLLNKEKIWEAHRSHLFQRLIKTGLRHDQVTILIMVPAAFLAAFEIYSFNYLYDAQKFILILGLVLFSIYFLFVLLREKQKGI